MPLHKFMIFKWTNIFSKGHQPQHDHLSVFSLKKKKKKVVTKFVDSNISILILRNSLHQCGLYNFSYRRVKRKWRLGGLGGKLCPFLRGWSLFLSFPRGLTLSFCPPPPNYMLPKHLTAVPAGEDREVPQPWDCKVLISCPQHKDTCI